MKIIPSEEIEKIRKNLKKLEKILEVKIEIKEKDIILEGTGNNEYLAEKVIDAINIGFPISTASLIKNKDFLFEIINIKNHTKRKDFKIIRARIIGTKGKALKTLSTLTDCHFETKENKVGIIGAPENIQNAHNAIISIIRGAKHSNVYSFLEKHRTGSILDLGLKE